jgi:hypothetical protein
VTSNPEKPAVFTQQYWKRPDPQPKGDDKAQTIYQAVGEALSQWEYVDQRLADLFLAFTSDASTDDTTKRAIRRAYGSIISTNGRRLAIRTAAEVYFGPPAKLVGLVVPHPPEAKDIEKGLVNILNAAQWAAKLRDDIAHGLVREDMEVVTKQDDKIIKEEQCGSFLMPPEYNTDRTYAHDQEYTHLSAAYKARYCYNSGDIDGIKWKFYELLAAITRYLDSLAGYLEKVREQNRAIRSLLEQARKQPPSAQ